MKKREIIKIVLALILGVGSSMSVLTNIVLAQNGDDANINEISESTKSIEETTLPIITENSEMNDEVMTIEKQNIAGAVIKANLTITPKSIVDSGTIGTVDWMLDDAGVLTFGGGVIPDSFMWYSLPSILANNTIIVNFTAPITLGNNTVSMFYGYKNLTTINGFEKLDASNVTRVTNMFFGCTNLTGLDLSNFNTSNVTTMERMFQGCAALKDLDVSNFDTSNVTNMILMFYDCKSLTDLNLSNFDTSNVTDMSFMFSGCANLTTLDVSNFNTTKVTRMNSMFYDCKSLTNLNLLNFHTNEATTMQSLFAGCIGLTNLNISNFNTSNVTDMFAMFRNCKNLTTLDLSSFDTSNVRNMNAMFESDPIKEIKLGTGFSFQTTSHYLNRPLNTPVYTGKWQLVSTNEVFTHDELLTYDGTKPGTYVWELRNYYNVNYDSKGGSEVASQSVENNLKVTIPTEPTKAGYTFDGWYKEENYATKWDFNTDLMPANNITLYAKWNINSYTVNYDSKGGSAVASETVVYNEKSTQPTNPTRIGYTFDGWYKEENYATKWDFNTDLMPANNITLYAKWTMISYNTVSYDSKGGSVVANETVANNQKITKPIDPTRVGYTFDGWYREENYVTKWDFNTDLMPANNITLYAKWVMNLVTVNKIPTINAVDITLKIGDSFNPLEGVSATDVEDGVIVLTIANIIANNVDTSKAGKYEVTYKVTDSDGGVAIKTIIVEVLEKDVTIELTVPSIKEEKADLPIQTGDIANVSIVITSLIGSIVIILMLKNKRKMN